MFTLLGKKITLCRELLGFSKKRMADVLFITPVTLSKYEKGITIPSLDIVYDLAQIMDIPIDSFVSDDISLDKFNEVCTTPLEEIVLGILDNLLEEIENKERT